MAAKKVKRRKGMKRSKARGSFDRTRQVLARIHSVSVDSPTVINFGDPALREAFRLWWHPYDMGPDFDELTGQDGMVIRSSRTKRGGRGTVKLVPATHPVTRGDVIERRRLDPDYYRRIDRTFAKLRASKGRKPQSRRPSTKSAPVHVFITLNYPLSEARSKLVKIDRRYPGEIFALTHDFYRELYAEDEEGGGKAGPMNGGRGPILNRGRGPLVWGHDLGDLVFESCRYRAFKGKERPHPLAEGEFTFGIGS